MKQMDEIIAKLREHSYRLPEGYCGGADYGCDAGDPENLIMAALDSAPLGTKIMQTITACGFTIVETDVLDEIEAIFQSRRAKLDASVREFEAEYLPSGLRESPEWRAVLFAAGVLTK